MIFTHAHAAILNVPWERGVRCGTLMRSNRNSKPDGSIMPVFCRQESDPSIAPWSTAQQDLLEGGGSRVTGKSLTLESLPGNSARGAANTDCSQYLLASVDLRGVHCPELIVLRVRYLVSTPVATCT